jgi:hypothetical protein
MADRSRISRGGADTVAPPFSACGGDRPACRSPPYLLNIACAFWQSPAIRWQGCRRRTPGVCSTMIGRAPRQPPGSSMDSPADIARRLAESAEAVCRRYLSNGRREGRYWLVGDVRNTPGRSLYVRLSASDGANGQAGKWTDAANGEHGDLLDVIAATCGHNGLRETLAEARRFLSLPQPEPAPPPNGRARKPPSGTPAAGRRRRGAARLSSEMLLSPVERRCARCAPRLAGDDRRGDR